MNKNMGSIAIRDRLGSQVRVNGRYAGASLVSLTAGQSYTASVTVINTSTKLGQPVAASLTVQMAGTAGSVVILASSMRAYTVPAGGSQVYSFDFTVPTSAGGLSGSIGALLLDPSGKQIGATTQAINITSANSIDISGYINSNGDIAFTVKNNFWAPSGWGTTYSYVFDIEVWLPINAAGVAAGLGALEVNGIWYTPGFNSAGINWKTSMPAYTFPVAGSIYSNKLSQAVAGSLVDQLVNWSEIDPNYTSALIIIDPYRINNNTGNIQPTSIDKGPGPVLISNLHPL